MRGLQNKRVLVTGGASGIGAATAARFVEEGSRVIVLDRDQAGCERIKQELPGLLAAIVVDVTNADAIKRVFADVDNLCQGVDVVINNAGISIRHKFMDITPEEWQQVVNVDLHGVFYVAQQAAQRMLDGEGGIIINMGSTNGLVGHPYYADYNAAKAGVIELTRTMALELAPTIRVVAVCPGYVLTPMQEVEYTPEMMATLNSKIPLNRHAKTSEIAALFAFLASEEAPYITGQTIVIDGGETAGGLASR